MTSAEFDRFAATYDEDLRRALATTGDDKEYFARSRLQWTRQCLATVGACPQRVLDFGCGTGSNSVILKQILGAPLVTGVDVSTASIKKARHSYRTPGLEFLPNDEFEPSGDYDLAFCNGVFHHIPAPERLVCLACIREALRSGGWFAFWENNPWNPGTRYVMSQCAFDRDAIPISPCGARQLVRRAGFRLLRVDSLFYFPRVFKIFRIGERFLRPLPLGGQYQVFCKKEN